MGTITQSYIEALGKQIFARDYILNGLFPCQSSIVKMIDLAKIDWKFNDKFEYRMLMANTNSGGTINTQTFESNFNLKHPGQLEYGIFQATYGALMDGFQIDMMKQLETRESRAAFNKEYAMRLHSMRINVASLFKNLVINGRYGTMHRIMPPLFKNTPNPTADDVRYVVKTSPGDGNGRSNGVWTPVALTGSGGTIASPSGVPTPGRVPPGSAWAFGTLATGTHIRIETPRNVFASNFKNSRLITRASVEAVLPEEQANIPAAAIQQISVSTGATPTTKPFFKPTGDGTRFQGRFAPWGLSYLDEMYVVYDNQPKMLELVYIGPTASITWYIGDILQLAWNRKVDKTVFESYKLNTGGGVATNYSFDANGGNVGLWSWGNKDGSTHPENVYSEVTGATEGLADLFPWYTAYNQFNPDQQITRLGINRFFRGQVNRLKYTTEQAGSIIMQQPDMSIMDAVMEGVDLAQSVTDWEDLVVWINPTTLAAIGMYEQMMGGNNGGLQVFKEANIDSKLIYQRGITGISYKIGEKVIPNVVKDYNLPTDVILIAPKKDIAYNCWDNAAFELNQYIQETWSGKKPPTPKEVSVPKEFATKLDLSSRITYGAPLSADLMLFDYGGAGGYNGFVHPSNSIPVAYHEMGTLFTENPFAYTVVKLANQIISPSDTTYEWWSNFKAG